MTIEQLIEEHNIDFEFNYQLREAEARAEQAADEAFIEALLEEYELMSQFEMDSYEADMKWGL